MLFPQSNAHRQKADLSGFWSFRFQGEDPAGWQAGFEGGQPLAVPASWNDQLAEARDHLGPAWYQTHFSLPWGWQGQRVFLRFGSVNYLAEAWLNGQRLGSHEGGHLPFEFEITASLQPGQNRLVVRVDGNLAPEHVPPGNVPRAPTNAFAQRAYPDANFDFFPFCGIHRPVLLYCRPAEGLDDLMVVTTIQGQNGRVYAQAQVGGEGRVYFTLSGHGAEIRASAPVRNGAAGVVLEVPRAAFWSPGAPNLYDLQVELRRGRKTVDSYTLPVGIRTIAVEGDRLLLNGEPIILKGFGRHEDFPINGRGLNPAVIIKDFDLMRWVGANSFRTTHYPYSDEMMDLADRLGFLVIDETPAVGLFFAEEGLEKRFDLNQRMLEEMIARDKNHPCVIMWSLANEPHSHGPKPVGYFRRLAERAREVDDTRPVTLVSYVGLFESAFEFLDVVCLNRYNGWYTESGQLEEGLKMLEAEIEAIHTAYPKPFLLTEFGADTIPGLHALPAEMFSEEYQVEFLTRYLELLNRLPYVVGQHVWNLCDFKTGQAVHRVGGMNYKGVFTRDRRPKAAAHLLRRLWKEADQP